MDAKTLGELPAGPTLVFERDNWGRVKAEGKHIQKKGITLRQHYAGLAMQALLAAGNGSTCSPGNAHIFAVQYADALLAELAKEQK